MGDYSKAIELDPANVGAYNNRGGTYVILKRYKQALEDFSKAIELDPEDVDTYYNRGSTYFYNLKRYDRALQDYRKVIELDPEDAGAYYNIACIKSMYKEIDEAFKFLDIAIRKGLDTAWAWEDERLELLRKDRRFVKIVGPHPNAI